MAHFAQLSEDDIVINVIVVANEDCLDIDGNESEEVGIKFCQSLIPSNSRWLQTSYSNRIRKKFAQIGDSYNQQIDAFVPPKPFHDAVFIEHFWNWVAPEELSELPEECVASQVIF